MNSETASEVLLEPTVRGGLKEGQLEWVGVTVVVGVWLEGQEEGGREG